MSSPVSMSAVPSMSHIQDEVSPAPDVKETMSLGVVSGKEPVKASYPAPAAIFTQSGSHGIRFDFNLGARIAVPIGQSWHVRLSDQDTGNVLFEKDISKSGAVIASSKRYFVRFKMEVWNDGALVFSHDYSARGQKVMVQFPIGTLGDTLGWFPYAVRFQEQHGCELTCAMSGLIIPLFKEAYPHIRFVTHEEVAEQKLAEEMYATYSMGLFFDDSACVHQPVDFRHVGLHRTAAYILGVDPVEKRPTIRLEDETRPIPEAYVVIAVQASSQCKVWNNPKGWRDVVQFFKASGYRVICIDKEPVHGQGLVWTHIPNGAEDQTGDRPLTERARWLKHADAFVGLSSGLAWLAWSLDVPAVVISGFTTADNEFHTPYRVINYHACNGCWNDPKLRFDHKDFLWCPRHAGTARQFECTKLITSLQVINAIRRIPGLTPHPAEAIA
jgi:autotransporter strand-loop-strand O-heptosyltransferase